MRPSAFDTKHLRDLVFQHKVVFEIRPAYAVADDRRLQVGFDVEISGTHSQAVLEGHEPEPAPAAKQGVPAKFGGVAVAAEDVSRDQKALRASLAARDARAIREDAAHLLQALGRIDESLDAVSAETRFQRLQFLRLSGAASR